MLSPTISIFLSTWQTLIATIAGIFATFCGFLLKDYFDARKQRKEARRMIEISLTRSMNEIHTVKKNILSFLDRVKRTVNGAKSVLSDDKVYFLEETNLPAMNVHFDSDLPILPTRSYYVHNKVCWLTASLSSVNLSLRELKERFENLSKKNEFMVSVNVSKKEQKQTYISNLEDFSKMVKESFIPSALDQGMKTLAETKIYNQKMRGRWGFYQRWKYEGTSFKYFRTYKQWRAYNQELSCIDRIEALTKKDVEELLKTIPKL